ncbi:amidohydrolase family protein [Actinocrispum wychmicini]|uniref:Imidazolonepropionase-like amidohydrolase n=1 Tax=Actinocrispum wychmicini TaxID=1213861 RepID=A0A4R2J0G3_9PSEU|nr:amidohydrolase family protein [Actinocrispum wychmicini]TCO50842.1 imidazolonepropionase-like amidohydrolase [Actinocrispum wychmicini]
MDTSTVIRNVRVFDGERVLPKADVLIDGDLIAAVAESPSDLRAATEVDGTGRTLLPGLIDAHTHAFDGSLAQALTFGVTTELDMFAMPDNVARLRRAAAESDDVADVRTAQIGATAPNGHPIQIMGKLYGPFNTVAGPEDAEGFVADRVAGGADYLKIVIDDGSSGGVSLPCLQPDSVAALVSAAHSAGLKTIAHVASAHDSVVALDAGIDGLAHIHTDGDAERIAGLAAAYGVFVVGAMSFVEALTAETGRELWRDERIWQYLSAGARAAATAESTGFPVNPNGIHNALETAAAMHRAGVPLLAGTDANDGPHGGFRAIHGASIHRELVLLTQAGLTPVAALAAATSVPARHFGLTDRGRVAVGLRADLVLVQGDPTTDITDTRSITDVWRRGTRHPRISA